MAHILNIAPISFENASISLEEFTYSIEKFEELLEKCRGTHLVKRNGDTILLVPLTIGADKLNGSPATIELKDNLSLVASLAKEALFRELLKKDCWISSIKPISYLVTTRNLMEDCIPSGVKVIQGLGVFARWEVDFRIINPLGTGHFVSMSINLGTAPRITMNCYHLISQGVSLKGYYVGKAYFGKNPELKPRFSTVGRVINVLDNGILELDDVRDGESSQADALTLYLEPREDILEYCIRCIYKQHAPEVLTNLEKKLAPYHIGNSKYSKLKTGLQSFQNFNMSLIEGSSFKIGDFLTDVTAQEKHLKILTAEKPLFVFAYGGAKHNHMNDFGLQKYGPYSKETFSPPKPRICVVCQLGKKGRVEQVLQKFLNGIPPVQYSKQGRTFEFTGLKTKFYLQDCILEFFTATDETIESYNKAISQALQQVGAGKGWDLALIQIDKNFKDLNAERNPYLVAKARFLGQQIPVQEFTLENLGLADVNVVWTINNMALATYAKLGGIPWLLTAEAPIAHEVVFGIGSAMVHNSRLGAKERMIGITTVFTGDGNYFINNISSAVYEDQYFETLLSNLRDTMERVKHTYNWQPRDTVRLIFHAFKTFKDVEATAVKTIMGELGDYNVEFAFVHVAPNHPYLLFDTSQSGIGYYKKGVFTPERTKFLQLSEHVSLVSLTGAQELKKANDGLPRPIQLILHKDSTFKDLTYLSKQVVKFGAHSWRSFQPAPMPVTVYYSQLMAQMLSQLAGVSNWNPDAIYNKIGTTRWFL